MKFPDFGTNVARPSHMIFICSTQNSSLQDLLQDEFMFEQLMRQLTPKEQVGVLNKKHSRNKALVQQLFQRIVLNYALVLNCNGSEFEPLKPPHLYFNEHGKPHFASSDIQFNSSSSDDLICIVVQFGADSPVGIDLSHENQDAILGSDYASSFAPIFSDHERLLLDQADVHKKYDLFNQLWTLKEAFTKFLGCGLNTDLSRFWFSWDSLVSETDTCSKIQPRETPGESFLVERFVSWQKVDVNLDALEEKWKAQIGAEPVRCSTATLREKPHSPVFVSLVAQSELHETKVCELDMTRILQELMDQDD